MLDLSPESTLAAGDHYNDLPMLSALYARHLLAPANAIEPVRDAVLSQGGFVSQALCGQGVLDGLRRLLEPSGGRTRTRAGARQHCGGPGSK